MFKISDVDNEADNSLPEEADTKVKNLLELLVGKTPKWELGMTVELPGRFTLSEGAVGSATWDDEEEATGEAGIGMIVAVDTETGRADDETELNKAEVTAARVIPVLLAAASIDEAGV